MHLNWKKHIRAGILLALILLICGPASAQASGQLPTDIRAQFGGIEITDAAYWDSPDSTWFVLIRTPDRVNRLLCYTLDHGAWTQMFQTSAAVPQGDGRVRILFSDRIRETEGAAVYPVLMILQYGADSDGQSVQLQFEFLRSASGVWNLFRAEFTEEQMRLEIDEDAVSFRSADDRDPGPPQSVTYTLERDLRRLDLSEIPKTPEQAQQNRGI